MIQLVLLGAAVAFLAWTKKPVVTAGPMDAPTDTTPLEPTFDSLPLTPKTKTTKAITGIAPVADGSLPPYVSQLTPEFSSFGTLEIDSLP